MSRGYKPDPRHTVNGILVSSERLSQIEKGGVAGGISSFGSAEKSFSVEGTSKVI